MPTTITEQSPHNLILKIELDANKAYATMGQLNSDLLVNPLITEKIKSNWQKSLSSSITIWTDLVKLNAQYETCFSALQSLDPGTKEPLERKLKNIYELLHGVEALKIRDSISERLHTWSQCLGSDYKITANPKPPTPSFIQTNLNCLFTNVKTGTQAAINNSGKLAILALTALGISKTEEGANMFSSIKETVLKIFESNFNNISGLIPKELYPSRENIPQISMIVGLAASAVFTIRTLFKACCTKSKNENPIADEPIVSSSASKGQEKVKG